MNNIEILELFIKSIRSDLHDDSEDNQETANAIENLIQENKELKEENTKLCSLPYFDSDSFKSNDKILIEELIKDYRNCGLDDFPESLSDFSINKKQILAIKSLMKENKDLQTSLDRQIKINEEKELSAVPKDKIKEKIDSIKNENNKLSNYNLMNLHDKILNDYISSKLIECLEELLKEGN